MRNIVLLTIGLISFELCYSQTKSPIKFENKSKIALEKFSILPAEIDGCACYFYLSKTDKNKERYISVNNFANRAYIKISGKMIKLNIIDSKKNYYCYGNNDFIMKIFVVKSALDEEGSSIKGKIIISDKKGNVIEKMFLGYCGC